MGNPGHSVKLHSHRVGIEAMRSSMVGLAFVAMAIIAAGPGAAHAGDEDPNELDHAGNNHGCIEKGVGARVHEAPRQDLHVL